MSRYNKVLELQSYYHTDAKLGQHVIGKMQILQHVRGSPVDDIKTAHQRLLQILCEHVSIFS